MTELPDIAAFEGDWQLARAVLNRLTGDSALMNGAANFATGGFEGGLIYREMGDLDVSVCGRLGLMHLFLWKPHAKGIEVHFEDGRMFHRIELDRLMPDAQFHSTPDMHYMIYDFTDWPNWNVQWRVRGPQTDCRMITRYKR